MQKEDEAAGKGKKRAPLFGQVVVGPPGAGKSTYCVAMRELLDAMGRRAAIVNLDPANEGVAADCDVDVRALVHADQLQRRAALGPNGALVLALELLERRADWLLTRLAALPADTYVLFDLPGQVELYTHHDSLRRLLGRLRDWGARLVSVHLVDSHCCTDAAKFVAALLTSLTAMLQLETPHLNLLSKADLLRTYGALPLPLDFYTDVTDLSQLQRLLDDDARLAKYGRLNAAVCGVVEQYGLVSFAPLDVRDKQCMLAVLKMADRANGFVYYDCDADDIRDMTQPSTDPVAVFLRSAADRYAPVE